MTEKTKARLEKALNHIKQCDGDCKHCNHCKVVVSKSALYYAFVCGVHGMNDYFTAVSDRMKTLKNDMIEAIQVELS